MSSSTIRLKEYDYSQAGAYFVTICAQNRECLFGNVVGAGPCACPEMTLNDAGLMVKTVWDEIPAYYPGVDIDAFQIMPNHIHGIIIVGAAPRGRPVSGQPLNGRSMDGRSLNGRSMDGRSMDGQPRTGQPRTGQPRGGAPTGLSLADVVHRFKTMTTKRYTDGVKQHGWTRFDRRLWQRNYYEHIVRNENEFNRIRQYIIDNPAKWESDRLYTRRGRSPCLPSIRESTSAYATKAWMI